MERRQPGRGRELSAYRRYELLTGEIVYPALGYDGYGDGAGTDLSAFISDEMRADWKENRTALLKFWRSGEYTNDKPWLFACSNGELPWAERRIVDNCP
jgi:hypothetical protein